MCSDTGAKTEATTSISVNETGNEAVCISHSSGNQTEEEEREKIQHLDRS